MEKLRNNILFIHFPDWFHEKEIPILKLKMIYIKLRLRRTLVFFNQHTA